MHAVRWAIVGDKEHKERDEVNIYAPELAVGLAIKGVDL